VKLGLLLSFLLAQADGPLAEAPDYTELRNQLEIWRDQFALKGLDSGIWFQDSCPQLLVRVPATNNNVENAILLHATSQDKKLLAAKMHLESIQKIPDRKRDVYIAVTCGGRETATFIHAFIRKLENFQVELTTAEKVELAFMGKLFPMLDKVKFVWNEGLSFDPITFSPWIMAPIGISQRGFWTGEIRLQAFDPKGTKNWATLNAALTNALSHLEKESETSEWVWRSLHYEHEEMAKRIPRERSWTEFFKEFLNPRSFFFHRSWEEMLVSRWSILENKSFEDLGRASISLQWDFLGSWDEGEIDRHLRQIFQEEFQDRAGIEISTHHLSPFMRSVYEGREARAIDRVLRRIPQVIPVPIISPQMTESKLFREAGLSCFDLTPVNLNHSFLQEKTADFGEKSDLNSQA